MYIAFTEEQAKKIRSLGVSVIEYKNCIRKGITVARYGIQKAYKMFCDAVETATKIWDEFLEKFYDAVDNVRMIIEDIKDCMDFPTSRRYKIVKFVSKLGYDKRKVWVATRHTWLARSNC